MMHRLIVCRIDRCSGANKEMDAQLSKATNSLAPSLFRTPSIYVIHDTHTHTETDECHANLSRRWLSNEFFVKICNGVVEVKFLASSEVRISNLKMDVVHVFRLRTIDHAMVILVSYLKVWAVRTAWTMIKQCESGYVLA